MRKGYCDKDLNEIDLLKRAELMEDRYYSSINDEYLGENKEFRVSTVWLGLDHNFGDGDPLIFETMVFYDGLGECPVPEFYGYQDRYSTLEQAQKGHKIVVKTLSRILTIRGIE